VGAAATPFKGVPAGFGLVIPYSQAGEPAVAKVEAGTVFGESSEFLGTYPTTAASKAAQLADDQAVVHGAVADILAGAVILGQTGTLVPTGSSGISEV
jgi:hypothetical protein